MNEVNHIGGCESQQGRVATLLKRARSVLGNLSEVSARLHETERRLCGSSVSEIGNCKNPSENPKATAELWEFDDVMGRIEGEVENLGAVANRLDGI